MFEKEAEEYANGKGHEHYNYLFEEHAGTPVDFARWCFQDGAEFGYNKGYHDAEEHYMNVIDSQHKLVEESKAKEWHYVKDGDLPKETGLLISKTLLLVTKMKGSDCLSLALGEYNFSTQEFSYQHIVGLTDVIAWKEIVLPELKESK